MKIKGLEYNHTYKTIKEKPMKRFSECPLYELDIEYVEEPLYTAEQMAQYAYKKIVYALSQYSGLVVNEETAARKIIDADWIENK